MTQQNIQHQLAAGIEAAQVGDAAKARAILLNVVMADEESELAWFWLSQVAEGTEQKRLCLENVLALNPSHPIARGQLQALEREPETPQYQTYSNYDDIWETERPLEMCPYCAQELDSEAARCPKCRRGLLERRFRYAKPSSSFHVYWVLILGLGQLFMLQVIIDVVGKANIGVTLLHAALAVIFFVLTPLLYWRFFWAFAVSMVILLLAATQIVAADLLAEAIANAIAGSTANTPLFGLSQGVANFITTAVRLLQLVAIAVAFFVGTFQTAPDFGRERHLMRAQLDRKLSSAGWLYRKGEELSKQQMWASAVLHWRKAVALDPTRLLYLLSLARGYGELGFHQRGLDVLKSAERYATTPQARATIAELRARIQGKPVV